MTRVRSLSHPVLVASLVLVVLSGCTPNGGAAAVDGSGDEASDGGGHTTISVDSGNDTCALSTTEAAAGNVVFEVTNSGDDVTEFYVLADDGLRIISEVENIGPGTTRDLVVAPQPGDYITACKPGMVGDGIRAGFTVTGSARNDEATGAVAEQVEAATQHYAAYVKDQTEQLLTETERFAASYTSGDDDEARDRYADTRVHWERIEPVAESFGDLDPRLDLREADLEPGQRWTGWHRIEKDLWPPDNDYTPMSDAERAAMADQLLADTQELYDRVHADDFAVTADQIGNGAKELLDEVATGKVTGEEEFWSHTDLWDFQANVDGARVAYENLRDVVEAKDPELADTLDTEFADLQDLLDQYRDGDGGFVSYDQLSREQVRELANAVDALGEPLSQLTAAVVL